MIHLALLYIGPAMHASIPIQTLKKKKTLSNLFAILYLEDFCWEVLYFMIPFPLFQYKLWTFNCYICFAQTCLPGLLTNINTFKFFCLPNYTFFNLPFLLPHLSSHCTSHLKKSVIAHTGRRIHCLDLSYVCTRNADR